MDYANAAETIDWFTKGYIWLLRGGTYDEWYDEAFGVCRLGHGPSF